MGKSVGKKVITMLVLMGIILLSVCIFNMVALKVIKDCNEQAVESFIAGSEAFVSGDARLAASATAAVMGNVERVGISISNVGVFNMIELAVAMLIAAVIIFETSRSVVEPAKRADAQLQELVNDMAADNIDLTKRIDVYPQGEIGQFADGINVFMESLQELVEGLLEDVRSMEDAADSLIDGIESSGKGAEGLSAVLKRLSADMEELSAAMGRLLQSGEKNIETAAEMSRRADEGKRAAAGIKECAEKAHRQSIENRDAAAKLTGDVGGQLEKALKDISSVKKIEELAGSIMNIAGHMDLLALNVSIEALRAGESGKSFVDAAAKIKQLAENSRDAAGGIQRISRGVAQAVERVGESAGEMLRFIGEDVAKDYESFENLTGRYAMDAGVVSSILDSFAGKASDIKEMTQKMGKNIKSISTTVKVDADGVSQTAGEAAALEKSIAKIKDEAGENRRIVEKLMEKTGKFKKV